MDFVDSTDPVPQAQAAVETETDRVSLTEEGKAYVSALELELAQLNALSTEAFSNLRRIVNDIIDRQKHPNSNEPEFLSVDEGNPVPIKLVRKVFIPTLQYPNFNFVGKLLGPGGSHLKQLVKTTNCRMFILGKGSTKDKEKEEELKNSGDPKYQHLGEPLHVRLETFAPAPIAYQQLAHAMSVISRVMRPVPEDNVNWVGFDQSGYGFGPMRGRGGYGPPPPFFGGPPHPMRGYQRGGRGRGSYGGYQRRGGYGSPRGGGATGVPDPSQQSADNSIPPPPPDCPETGYTSVAMSDQMSTDPNNHYASDAAGVNGGNGGFYSESSVGAADSNTYQPYADEQGGGKAAASSEYDRPSPY